MSSPLKQDAAAGDLVLGRGQERGGQGGLARPVGAHQGVDLAGADREVDALEDLRGVRDAGGTGPEAVDLRTAGTASGGDAGGHARQCISTTAIVEKVLSRAVDGRRRAGRGGRP